MKIKIPISICLFMATKGRFGFTDCYKHTILKLQESIPLCDFGNLSAHIKITNKEEVPIYKEMYKWLEGKGFNIYGTIKNWDKSDGGLQHAEGYYQDMLKLLDKQVVHSQQYMLLLEDDWLINSNYLTRCFFEAVNLLNSNKDILCVRINNKDDPINQKLDIAEKINSMFYLQTENTGAYGSTLTFQPTIMRTRDWWTAVRHINKNWEKLKYQHCELVSGDYMKGLFTDNPRPFAFFHPDKVNCEHIGCEEFINKQKTP